VAKFLVMTQMVHNNDNWVEVGRFAVNTDEVLEIHEPTLFAGREYCSVYLRDKSTIYFKETFSEIMDRLGIMELLFQY
jgi:hypothetical protein